MPKSHLLRLATLGAVIASIGCGGSSSTTTQPATGTLNFSGGDQVQTTPTTTTTVPATGGSTISTAAGGTAVVPSGSVPAGTTVDPSVPVLIVPKNTGFTGTYTSGVSLGVNDATDTGAAVSTSGLLAQDVALPITDPVNGTPYTLTFPAGTLNTSRDLTVKQTTLSGRIYIRNNMIISPIPTDLAGTLPNNGQNAVHTAVIASFGAGNDGRTATLTVDYGTGFVLHQTKTISNNGVTFQDLTTDTQSVPSTGVKLVSLAVGPLP